MAGKASATLDSTLAKKLESLSKSRRVSRDKLVNSAVRVYLRKVSSKQRKTRELIAAAKALAIYRQNDPGFERAIDAFVAHEAGGTAADPAEGKAAASPRRLRASLDAILHG